MKFDDELLSRMRLLEKYHRPEGWPAVQMLEVTALCDEIDRLRALKMIRRCPACLHCVEIEHSEEIHAMVYAWHTYSDQGGGCSNSYKPCDEAVDDAKEG